MLEVNVEKDKNANLLGVIMIVAGLYLSYKLGAKVGYNEAIKDVTKVLEVSGISQK